LRDHVKTGCRLIEDCDRWPTNQRQRYRSALLLATRQLVWITTQEFGVCRQVKAFERRIELPALVFADAVKPQSIGNLTRQTKSWIERCTGILEYVGNFCCSRQGR
jgi:hypothetical protein